jgi:hypothetical protein
LRDTYSSTQRRFTSPEEFSDVPDESFDFTESAAEKALTLFFAVAGFSPDWFGFRPSDLVNHQFGIDVVLGLLAAATFAAGGKL